MSQGTKGTPTPEGLNIYLKHTYLYKTIRTKIFFKLKFILCTSQMRLFVVGGSIFWHSSQ